MMRLLLALKPQRRHSRASEIAISDAKLGAAKLAKSIGIYSGFCSYGTNVVGPRGRELGVEKPDNICSRRPMPRPSRLVCLSVKKGYHGC